MLHWHQIWRHMRELTGKEVEKRAVMELITYFEKQIDLVIIQSGKELEILNNLRKTQGLYQKSRIDAECIKNSIKTINSDNYSSSSVKTGGIKENNKEKIEKHSHEENVLTEVT